MVTATTAYSSDVSDMYLEIAIIWFSPIRIKLYWLFGLIFPKKISTCVLIYWKLQLQNFM